MKPHDVIDADFTPTTALAVSETSTIQAPALFGTTDPVEVVAMATRVANALMGVIESKKLYKVIGTKKHIYVEAWQTCAAMLGLTPVCEWSRPVDDGWEARVVVKNVRGDIMGAAEAQCLKSEQSKRSWDGYALRSMSQTRATSKALRSVLGFVAVLAGYNATPAEEMPDEPAAQPAANRVAQPDAKAAVIARARQLGVIPPQGGIDELRAYCADHGVVTTPSAINAHLDGLQTAKETPPQPKAWAMSDAQRARLMALHGEVGHVGETARYAFYADICGRIVASSKELSKLEYETVTTALKSLRASAQGAS